MNYNGANLTTAPRPQGGIVVLVGLLIAYSPSYINILLRKAGVEWSFLEGPPSILLWNWLAVILIFLFIHKIEGLSFNSIGFAKPNRKDIQWAVIFWGFSTIFSGIVNAVLPPSQQGLNAILELPIIVIILIILTTSTTEEILFRGYPIERLRSSTGMAWLAILVSFVLFTIPHVTFFGFEWLIYNGFGVILLYVLYIWRRNLWACMTMHLLGNSLILLPALRIA